MAFSCPRCGAVSYNSNDERQGYCGRCKDWTSPVSAIRLIADKRMYRSHAALMQNGEVFRLARLDELGGLRFDALIVHPDVFEDVKAKLEQGDNP